MKQTIRVKLHVLLLIAVVPVALGQRVWPDGRKPEDPDTWNWNIPDPMEHVLHGVVYSQAMNRNVGYNIYLPPSYDVSPKKRFSVVYFLHGASGDEKSSAFMMNIIFPEIQTETIPEAIFVFVNGGHWSSYRDYEHNYVKSETHIIQELIPTIDKRYRTITDREGRAIFGWSMGGGGATRFALKYPDLFCVSGSFSGALDWARDSSTGERTTSQAAYPEDNIYYWAKTHQANIKDKMGFYFTVGGSEWLYDDHPPFLNYLRELEIEFDYSVKGDLGHNLGTSKELFGSQMIRFLGAHYKAPE